MKKEGQPESALEITAGRRSLLSAFNNGIAGAEEMRMAANWLRDLVRHWDIPENHLNGDILYRRLMLGDVTDHAGQILAASWLNRLAAGKFNAVETKLMNKTANDRQVAGDHYRKGIQHWDFVVSRDCGYLAGQVTKYVSRWKDKNGKVDLEKANHFLDKMIEVHENTPDPIQLIDYMTAQGLSPEEALIVAFVVTYEQTGELGLLTGARQTLAKLLEAAPDKPVRV